jgi:hypothetical protein
MLYLWPVSDFSWAPVLAALARAFAERGMRAHAEKLAQFKARYEEQQRKLERLGSRRPWTTEDLVRHAAALQIAPFAGMVPVVPNDKRCPFCRVETSGRNAAPVVELYVDRTMHECRNCSRRWLHLTK